MSLKKNWDYNERKLIIHHSVINAYVKGKVSRAEFAKQLAGKLKHDPLLLVELLTYLDKMRTVLAPGVNVVEVAQHTCKSCHDPQPLTLEHHTLPGIKEKYLINFEDCDCWEDYLRYEDYDTEIY